MVSVALPYALESPRLFGLARTGASRCTCHVAVAGEGQVDRELLGWVEEAYQYSLRP